MKMIIGALLLLIAIPALAQVPPRPVPLPPHNWPNPGPWNPNPWPGQDPWGDRCFGRDYDRVLSLTRANGEEKAESWGTAKGVQCDVTKVSLDMATAMCVNDNGSKFARLRMYMNTTCGPRWGNSSRLRLTKILYY